MLTSMKVYAFTGGGGRDGERVRGTLALVPSLSLMNRIP